MFQTPIPRPDSIPVDVPLPSGFERWRDLYLGDAGEKLLVLLAFALVLYVAARIARRQADEQIQEVNRRHAIRKWIGYGYVVLLFLAAVALFAESLAGLGAVLAVVLAGVAFALQDVLRSVVGWLYISTRSGIQVGSRIEVAGVVGDVVDVGLLKTTVLEVGNLVFGRQSTGRLATIPNSRMLSEHVFVSSPDSPYVWQETRFVVTFESDWRRAEEILREIGDEINAEIATEIEQGFHRLERRYALKHGALTPIVYVTVGQYGIELTLRFLVHARGRRGNVDRVTRLFLQTLAAEPNIQLAYPTQRFYKRGE